MTTPNEATGPGNAPDVKSKSRSRRWTDAVSRASDALNELVEIRQEYQDWLDNLPENLQESPVGEKLESICNIDVDSALEIVNEAEGADLPLGFGRD